MIGWSFVTIVVLTVDIRYSWLICVCYCFLSLALSGTSNTMCRVPAAVQFILLTRRLGNGSQKGKRLKYCRKIWCRCGRDIKLRVKDAVIVDLKQGRSLNSARSVEGDFDMNTWFQCKIAPFKNCSVIYIKNGTFYAIKSSSKTQIVLIYCAVWR